MSKGKWIWIYAEIIGLGPVMFEIREDQEEGEDWSPEDERLRERGVLEVRYLTHCITRFQQGQPATTDMVPYAALNVGMCEPRLYLRRSQVILTGKPVRKAAEAVEQSWNLNRVQLARVVPQLGDKG